MPGNVLLDQSLCPLRSMAVVSLLAGKAALITGASSGVGAGLAAGFAQRGADVAVNYSRNAGGAERTAQRVQDAGQRCMVAQADVGVRSQVEAMLDKVESQLGELDILVNNAGITLKMPFLDTTEQEWDSMMSTNLKGAFLCSQAAARRMASRGGGAILNVSSVHAATTTYNFAAYAATKGGLEALTRSMAIELGGCGIRVNALRLGWIQVERDHITPDDPSYAAICERIPAGRPGNVEDVVPLAALVCSDQSPYLTGAVIPVHGGHEAMLNTAFARGHLDGGAVVREGAT